MRRLHELWPDLQFGSDLSTALRTLGRGDEVPALIDAWIKQAPDNELARVQRVLTDVARHRPDDAARHAHDLLLLEGAGPVRLATLCDVLMLIDHLGEARQRADELLELPGSDRLVGWSRKAQLALLEGKFAPAADALQKVIGMPDNDITGDMLYALDDLRRLAQRMGKPALELAAAERLVVMWQEIPAREAVFAYRRDLLRDKKCPPLDRALAAVPPGEAFATARLNILRAAATAGCTTRAAVVKAGMLPDESDMGSLFEFAVAAEQEGALGLARDALEKVREIHVLSIDSTSSVTPYCSILARYHLGRVLEKLGQRAAARAQYQDFLDHWGHADRGVPEVDAARAALQRL
jgi:tetratricopeptide (TPR) repeat protein